MQFGAIINNFNNTCPNYFSIGTDSPSQGDHRTFMAHPFCREAIGLKEGKAFLIMGKTEDLIKDEEG